MDNDDGEEVPSWLKDDNNIMGGSAETQRLVMPQKNILKPSSSYGGQSGASASSNPSNAPVEEDYGDDNVYFEESPVQHNAGNHEVDTSWAVESNDAQNYGSTQYGTKESDDDDSSDDDDDDDESSSSEEEEEETDEETPIIPKKKKNNRKNKNKRKKKSINWEDSQSDTDGSLEEDVDVILVKPRRNCCHSFFIAIQITAILANISMILIEIVPIMVGTLEQLDIVLRCYFAFFCTFFLFAEFELFKSGLDNWIARGFLYTFLGVVAKEQHIAMLANDTLLTPKQYWNGVPWASIFVSVTSWCIIGLGCTYFVFGIFCLKQLRDRFRNKFQEKMRLYKGSL